MSSPPLPAGHADMILRTLNGRSPADGVDPWVIASWKRCAESYHLDPLDCSGQEIVDSATLKERREKCCDLVEIAKSEMTNLYQQVAGSGYSILLSDHDGVVLKYIGDPLFTTAAASTGMQTGAIWSERAQGTNGIGTCLEEKRPLVIHKQEHFFVKNTGLTCSAAPIFDPAGRLAGVLDASSESKLAQHHTMVLVNMSAQLIENRLFTCRMRNHFILRFHSRPEFVGTLGEGAIAFDPAGMIRAANRSALFQLSIDSFEAIRGKSINTVFNTRIDDVIDQARKNPAKPCPLRDRENGRRFFALFHPPLDALRTNIPAAKDVKPQPICSSFNGTALRDLGVGDTRMRRNVERAAKLIEKDIPFMILGETGTGKDVFAKAVHSAGPRRNKPFVAVNCASIPETLIESELFGYCPGAFTGAKREGSRGKIVQADGGTLFLDEIGDMPTQLQARLLRVLEEREVIPLGGETPIKVDIHLISATHQDLIQRVAEGSFREDIYYRLHGISLSMPPLREREDRVTLIRHLIDVEAGGVDLVDIETDALEALDNYDWPGNIRQLRNVLRTLIGLCENARIRMDDLPEEIFLSQGDSETSRLRPNDPLSVAERDAILRELEAAHWNITRVASKLSLSRNTLYRKMKRYGIKPPR